MTDYRQDNAKQVRLDAAQMACDRPHPVHKNQDVSGRLPRLVSYMSCKVLTLKPLQCRRLQNFVVMN